MKKKVLFSETLKSKLFLYQAFLSIKVRFDRKWVNYITFSANLHRDRPERSAIGQFEPELTKTTRDWPIWAQTDQSGAALVNLGPN